MQYILAVLLSIGLLPTLSGSATASTQVSGTLFATDSCPAYASIRKQTNPGDIHLKVNLEYGIREINKANSPTWLRIEVEDTLPRLRWVSIKCGEYFLGEIGTPAKHNCNTAGFADSYVLALSWQPAFCQRNRHKTECQLEPADNGFSLHGLWPNRKACGIKYGFCGDYEKPRRPFCIYSPLTLTETTRTPLERVMPSAKAGSCLQRHQWHKHGTCQTHWDQNQYFSLSTRLTNEFKQSAAAKFIQQHRGQYVNRMELFKRFEHSFGENSKQAITITCKGKMLTEVRIKLPKDLSKEESLNSALNRSSGKAANYRCGKRIYIDAPGP